MGTGPYRLKSWTRGQQIVLEANPDFRDETYPAPGRDPGDAAIAKGLTGRKLPLDRDRRHRDHRGSAAAPAVVRSRRSSTTSACRATLAAHRARRRKAEARAREARRRAAPADRAVAGVLLLQPGRSGRRRLRAGEDRAAPRGRAWATTATAAIRQLANGQAVLADQPVPPGLYGHDSGDRRRRCRYDPAAARALLDRFGYKDRDGDGYRETPDGKPLTLVEGLDDRRGGAREPTSCGSATWTRSASASRSSRTSGPS